MPDTLAILAHHTRRDILRLVWNQERSAGDIAARFPVTFGAVSQHLAILRDAGLVTRRRDGKQQLYRADPAALGPLAPALEAMWTDRLAILKDLAEDEQDAIDTRRARDWTGIHAPRHREAPPPARKPRGTPQPKHARKTKPNGA